MSRRDSDPAGKPKPKGVARCWYVQGRYLLDSLLYAEYPIYFDSKAEAEADVRRQRDWPPGSSERYVDICEQRYFWDDDGSKRMDVPMLLDAINKDIPMVVA